MARVNSVYPLQDPQLRPDSLTGIPSVLDGLKAQLTAALEASHATAKAHETFLLYAEESARIQQTALQQQLDLLQRLAVQTSELEDADWRDFDGSFLPNGKEVYASPDQLSILNQDSGTEAIMDSETAQLRIARRRSSGFAADGTPLPPMVLDREACLEFAVGSIERALGPDFAQADTFPTRVRLPDEPLMLVDRITLIEGSRGTPGSGRVVTEHDVWPEAWYLDGGRAPVCISVEAGQADLFLSGWLGIDRLTRGERVYRLLDARVTFHRDLPQVGEVIRYDIHIDRFIRQGDTWMFFFHFEGYIGTQHLISMRDGCAGFFSREQLDQGKGIIQTTGTTRPPRRRQANGRLTAEYVPLLPLERLSLDDAAVDALRDGRLEAAFGPEFAGLTLPPSLRLPSGRMRLVHRILDLDPAGGSYGLGTIFGEADVEADAWYLTCHFSDDPVMPGTLMYECCLHTLRILLLRLGWVGPLESIAVSRDLHYSPISGITSRLKCRGQVIPGAQKVGYQIDLKELGYDPQPYAVADVYMYADGKKIVFIEDMTCVLSGCTQQEQEAVWNRSPMTNTAHHMISASGMDAALTAVVDRIENPSTLSPRSLGQQASPEAGTQTVYVALSELIPGSGAALDAQTLSTLPPRQRTSPRFTGAPTVSAQPLYTREHILAYAVGRPSEGFGPEYLSFDRDRRLARLPGPPFLFMDRVTSAGPDPFVMKVGSWAEAQYDVPPTAWYFKANGQNTVPFAVILETALQPCGWLAAWMGSGLRSQEDLHFRNLEGTATLFEEIPPDIGTLTVRVELLEHSEAGGMILQKYSLELWGAGRLLYQGDTRFGFFPSRSLAQQVGVRGAELRAWKAQGDGRWLESPDRAPTRPFDCDGLQMPVNTGLSLPSVAFQFVDRVYFEPSGGPSGLGYLSAVTPVRPSAWYFDAHFFQDPVIPGSIGLEAFLQLLKRFACERWPALTSTHRFQSIATGIPQTWIYRGQVIPKNQEVTVEAYITGIEDGPMPLLTADGFLKVDGRIIYEMKGFALRLVPELPAK